jgi:hypothetical protein
MVSDVTPEGAVGAGLPMPEVEGYKYVYPKYTYNGHEAEWARSGYSEDRDAYDYYPYWPSGVTGGGSILVGVELKRE